LRQIFAAHEPDPSAQAPTQTTQPICQRLSPTRSFGEARILAIASNASTVYFVSLNPPFRPVEARRAFYGSSDFRQVPVCLISPADSVNSRHATDRQTGPPCRGSGAFYESQKRRQAR